VAVQVTRKGGEKLFLTPTFFSTSMLGYVFNLLRGVLYSHSNGVKMVKSYQGHVSNAGGAGGRRVSEAFCDLFLLRIL
jgi:hypothetical protein